MTDTAAGQAIDIAAYEVPSVGTVRCWAESVQPNPPDGRPGEKPRVCQRLLPPPHNSARNLPGVFGKVLAGFFLASGIFGGAAFADEAPAKPKAPDFVPFVVDQVQDQAARAYLNGLTFKDAAPLVTWLNELQARAKGQWEADHAVKPAEAVKP